jgi:anaerobic ribonucleoside-triphosphate reductase activating protein
MAAEGARRSRRLRLHTFIPQSYANGPGCRAVVWVQGCTLGCPGCFNPETHDFRGGEWVRVDALFERIYALQGAIEGITVSGGEPFQQRPALLALLQRVRAETDLSVLVFTGYTWDEIQRFRETAALLSCIDVLIAGRYDARLRLARDLRGSANKTVHLLTPRYSLHDLQLTPVSEVIIEPDGTVLISGIDPLRWQ